MICFAHRGARGHAPENTLASFAKAIELGAQWIELDVQEVEGRLVVFHDERLERTTNAAGYLRAQSITYLRGLDAGDGEKIPFLEEVFELIGNKVGLNIELKSPQTAEVLAQVLKQRFPDSLPVERLLVSSFDQHELAHFRNLLPAIPRALLLVGIPLDLAAAAEAQNCKAVHPSLEFVNQEFVDDAHRRGLKVHVFTVNYPDDIERMFKMKVDGVFSDYPERVIGHLYRKQLESSASE